MNTETQFPRQPYHRLWGAASVYGLMLVAFACAIWRQPAYNMDILPYMAEIKIYDGQRGCVVHDLVYQEAARTFPPAKYESLIGESWLRQVWAHDCGAFFEQLPFYSIRPGYIGTAFLFHKLGLPPARALVLVSIVSFLVRYSRSPFRVDTEIRVTVVRPCHCSDDDVGA